MRQLVLCLILILALGSVAYASEDGRTDKGVIGRKATVLGRGLLNIVGAPFELIRTPIAEWENHTWLWPVTVLPRTGTNMVTRMASGVHDVIVYPWVVPFTDDISPITEPFGLPEYVWSHA